jgi:DNA modification methylase
VNETHLGDCRETLRTLDAGIFRCCVTSPPYWGLRDYGVDGQLGLEPTPEAYVAAMVDVFREVRRVLADDGTLWLNLGDSYASTPCGNPGDASKSGLTSPGVGTDLVVRGQKRDTIVAGLKPKDLVGIPWMVAFALRADGWYLRSDIIWSKANPMPESVTDRPTKAHEYLFLMSKSARYYYDADAIREASITNDHRRPYMSPGARSLDGRESWRGGEPRNGDDFTARNRRTVWTIPTAPYSGAHFATFPPALVTPCILAGSALGDAVLDPFMGSGTVGQVAESLGRRWFGCELNPEYVRLSKERTGQAGLPFGAVP